MPRLVAFLSWSALATVLVFLVFHTTAARAPAKLEPVPTSGGPALELIEAGEVDAIEEGDVPDDDEWPDEPEEPGDDDPAPSPEPLGRHLSCTC